MAAVHAESYSEVFEHIHPGELKIQDVDLEDVLAKPQAYVNVRVRFRCMFVENGVVFDAQHTYYNPATFLNLIVYDDNAAVWDPTVRSQPVLTMYLAKDRKDASIIAALKKFQLIDVVGEVTSVIDGAPLITAHTVRAVPSVGSFSDASVYHVEQANTLSGEGAYDLAEDHYVAALKENLPVSDHIQVTYLRAKALMAWGHYIDCAKVLREALALSTTKNTSRLTQAGMHYLIAKAIAETGEASSAEVHAARYREAVGHARTAVELDPEQGDAYAVLGITLAGMGEFDEARRQCEKAIRLRPNNAEVRWYLGRILDQQGSYEEAIEALRKAIDLTPKDHRIHKAIGAVYLHRGQKGGPKAADDFVTALREYDIAIRLNAADPETHYGSGLVLEAATAANVEVQIGAAKQPASFAMAIERYKNAVTADAKYLPARHALASRYRADNQPDEAVAQLRAIAEIEPEREENFFELGRYLWSLGRKEDAYAAYQQCLTAHPDSITTLYTLGHVALDMGNFSQGILWEERLLKVQPKHGPANLDMAKLKLGAGFAKEAGKYARLAEEYLADPDAKEEARAVQRQAEGAPAEPPKAKAPEPSKAKAPAEPPKAPAKAPPAP
jgi:tetratricopeptide (TPR) repeat protein